MGDFPIFDSAGMQTATGKTFEEICTVNAQCGSNLPRKISDGVKKLTIISIHVNLIRQISDTFLWDKILTPGGNKKVTHT